MWVFVVIGFSLGAPFLSHAGTRKTIIFRDDDAQAYFSTDLLKVITDTLITNNIPQTISVVPAHINGETLGDDPELVEYLNAIKDYPTVELALHGYQHTKNEFGGLTLAQAETNLVAGLAVMSQLLGVTPVTFVPPYNVFNTNTLTACNNLGFTCFSAAAYNEPDAWTEAPAGLLHVPTTVDFQDWSKDGQFKSSAAIIQEAQKSLDTNDVTVFQLHFWAFGDTNEPQQLIPENYQTLLDVINWVLQKQSNGVELMTIGQFTRSETMTLPVANFTVSPLNGFAPLTVTFTDTSTAGIGTITNRQWRLGNSDITNITSTHLTLTGVSAGTYSVTLIVSDNTRPGRGQTVNYNFLGLQE
jgi:predicted deacetylase